MSNPLTKIQDAATKKIREEAAKGAREAVLPLVKVSIGLSAFAIALGIANWIKRG